jgi:AcrR family transcriptional regulator
VATFDVNRDQRATIPWWSQTVQERVRNASRRPTARKITVYNHFSNKSSILHQLVRDYMAGYQRIGLHLRSGVDPHEPIYDLLRNMVRDAMLWRIENAELASPPAAGLPDRAAATGTAYPWESASD